MAMSIRTCHVDLFELLVKAGADLNAADSTGFTPLMSAGMGVEEAEKGVVMARALLRTGADLLKMNAEGCIAPNYAAAEGSADVVDILLAKAPKTASHVTIPGSTPLHYAVFAGNEEAVVRLLAAGAAQPRLYQCPFCPLTHAVVDGNERLVRILLRRARAVRGDAAVSSALEVSVVQGKARLLQLLLLFEGEERRERWANCTFLGRRILRAC